MKVHCYFARVDKYRNGKFETDTDLTDALSVVCGINLRALELVQPDEGGNTTILPITRRRGKWHFKAKTTPSMSEFIGCRCSVYLRFVKYSFTSKLEHNFGELVEGIRVQITDIKED
jgi:hypothetical protein|tara:strand:+ start:86959 stop:87309 length:351 start_codon:yes stop_codon:yes gene_type:complete